MDASRLRRLEESFRATWSRSRVVEASDPAEKASKVVTGERRSIRFWLLRKPWYLLLRGLRNLFVAFAGHFPKAVDRLERLILRVFPEDAHPFPSGVLRSLIKRVQPIFLDYPVEAHPRWGYRDRPLHPEISRLLETRAPEFVAVMETFLTQTEHLARIPWGPEDAQPDDPTWTNDWFGGMDGVALYGLIATEQPSTYIEIGSGMSTKFARRCIRDNDLSTRIISIDPTPRAEIDALCDVQIREPVEEVDLSIFERLRSGDIVFLDGSHRAFMNSDVVVFFLEILPRLPEGVLIHLHDILLPADYFPAWAGRYYSEQYMLAAFLLGGARGADVVLPCAFVSLHPRLLSVLIPIWAHPEMEGVPPHGSSFWMRTTTRPTSRGSVPPRPR